MFEQKSHEKGQSDKSHEFGAKDQALQAEDNGKKKSGANQD